MKKNSEGITLVALVITIIVLLILAGVSLSFVVGDNGVLSTAIKIELEAAKGEVRDRLLLNINSELLSCSTEIYGTVPDISTQFNEIKLINFLAGHSNYVGTGHDDTAAVLCIEKLGTDSNDANNAKAITPRGGNLSHLSAENSADLISKGLVTEDNKIYNLYRVIPEALSTDISYGKGKKISDGDIFVIEAVDDDGNRIPEDGTSSGKYILKYYDKEGKITVLETVLLYKTNQS